MTENYTLNEVFSKWLSILSSADVLLSRVNFENSYDLSEVKYDRHNPDDVQKIMELTDMMRKLNDMYYSAKYLTRSVIHEGVLWKDSNGRYTDDYKTYTSGSSIEVLIDDGYSDPHWEVCRVEYNGNDYYLVEHSRIPMYGLQTRVRSKD